MTGLLWKGYCRSPWHALGIECQGGTSVGNGGHIGEMPGDNRRGDSSRDGGNDAREAITATAGAGSCTALLYGKSRSRAKDQPRCQ